MTQYVEFSVKSKGDQASVVLQYAQLPDTVKHLNEKQLYVGGEFTVIHVEEDCLMVELARENEGKRNCLLWEILGDSENHSSSCRTKLESECTPILLDLTQHIADCKRSHDYEKRVQEYANREETA
ncbi:uncharacterized protein LOC142591138 [Dermacentor variabilis]|uniref:uncharacterized protein LOC142591138 n=1 Tax=Dermacentor variabilis TaxID=34621 RepID=UPI003F5B324D